MSTTTDDTYMSGVLTIDQAAAYRTIPKATLYTWRTRRVDSVPERTRSAAACVTAALTRTPGSMSTSSASTKYLRFLNGASTEQLLRMQELHFPAQAVRVEELVSDGTRPATDISGDLGCDLYESGQGERLPIPNPHPGQGRRASRSHCYRDHTIGGRAHTA